MDIYISNNFKLLIALVISVFINLSYSTIIAQHIDSTIFRSITLNEDKKVSLGQNISELSDLCVKDDKGYYLKEGTFTNAKSINFIVDDRDHINSIYFHYNPAINLKKLTKAYSKSIGRPIKNVFQSDSIKIKVFFWHDAYSIFEIVEVTKNGKESTYSVLFDQNLYKQYLAEKLKEDITSKLQQNSLEIIRIIR